jgi:ribonucleoside-diphosphate reductase alpha chain
MFQQYPVIEFSDNAKQIIAKRYLETNETTDDLFNRVATTLSNVGHHYNISVRDATENKIKYYDVMRRGLFLPAGRTLRNVGTKCPVVCNCVVLHIEDTMEDIFQTLKDAALLQKGGSGLGFPLHLMRPAGMATKASSGVSSGPISFLHVYNMAFGVIKQQNRHGANMAIMDVSHPDILEFIRCKEKEGSIKNFNVSVGLTDAFMEAVERKDPSPWLCSWRDQPMKPRRITRDASYGFLKAEEATMTASEIFHEIATYGWRNGEPGFVFKDTANKTNPIPGLGKLEATNPCITSDSWITTTLGPKQVKELINTPFEVPSPVDPSKSLKAPKGFFSTGIKPVYRLTTKEGYEIKVTDNHRLLTFNGWKEAKDMAPGDLLHLDETHPTEWEGRGTQDEGYLCGLVMGDGCLTKQDNGATRGVLSLWDNEDSVEAIAEEVDRIVLSSRGKKAHWQMIPERKQRRYVSRWLGDLCNSHGLIQEDKHPGPLIEGASSEFYKGFLRGFFDTDGCVQGSSTKNGASIRLNQSHLPTLQVVQRMLLRLGMFPKIYSRRAAGEKLMPNGKGGSKMYPTVENYDLILSGKSIQTFADTIGFIRAHKAARVTHALTTRKAAWRRERTVASFIRLEYLGEEEVFDTTIRSKEHCYCAQGLLNHNCSEQWLHDGDVCNLGAINLKYLVKRIPWTIDHEEYTDAYKMEQIDWDTLTNVTRTAVEMLDSVIDLLDHPSKRVQDMAPKNRRIGLGIMGFADMLFRLHISYDSDLGRTIAARIMKTISEEAKKKSREMCVTRGVFPNNLLAREDLRDQRNAALTTVAPTGTTSMVYEVSGGVEPHFALSYRKINILGGMQLVYVNDDLMEALKELHLDSDEIKEQIIKDGTLSNVCNLPKELTSTFVTAMDISPRSHVLMQAAFQEYVDNSISKTINLPNNATIDDVKGIITLSWKSGNKGCTVYRDGSRMEQVLETGASKKVQESCPICNGTLIRKEGCISCSNCDYAKCAA